MRLLYGPAPAKATVSAAARGSETCCVTVRSGDAHRREHRGGAERFGRGRGECNLLGVAGDVRRARRHCHAASTRRRCARLSWAACSGVACAVLLRLVDVWRCHTRRLMPDVKRYVTRRAPIVRSSERGTCAYVLVRRAGTFARTYPVTPRAGSAYDTAMCVAA